MSILNERVLALPGNTSISRGIELTITSSRQVSHVEQDMFILSEDMLLLSRLELGWCYSSFISFVSFFRVLFCSFRSIKQDKSNKYHRGPFNQTWQWFILLTDHVTQCVLMFCEYPSTRKRVITKIETWLCLIQPNWERGWHLFHALGKVGMRALSS